MPGEAAGPTRQQAAADILIFIAAALAFYAVEELLRQAGMFPFPAAFLNGLPFGLIHFEWGLGGILLTIIMGSVLGLMFLAAKRNLWPMIVAHATLDALLMTLLYFGITP